MPDTQCADDLRYWADQAKAQGYSDSASLLSRAASRVDDQKPDGDLAAELSAYRDTVAGRRGLASFANLLGQAAEALRSRFGRPT